jgi:hypothetical protein
MTGINISIDKGHRWLRIEYWKEVAFSRFSNRQMVCAIIERLHPWLSIMRTRQANRFAFRCRSSSECRGLFTTHETFRELTTEKRVSIGGDFALLRRSYLFLSLALLSIDCGLLMAICTQPIAGNYSKDEIGMNRQDFFFQSICTE